MEDDQRVKELVKELIKRLLTTRAQSSSSQIPSNSTPSNFGAATGNVQIQTIQQAHKYAIRILYSRITPSISADEASMAESIKRHLATQGKSSDALSFADLYSKFSSKSGPGSINNKWAVLYMLKVISEDRKNKNGRASSSISFGSAVSGGLPSLLNSERNDDSRSLSVVDNTSSRVPRSIGKSKDGGVLLVAKDPENIRDLAYREFSIFVKEVNEISEEVLVRDILYACQGIDGKVVKYDKDLDGYVLPDNIRLPRAKKTMVLKLCELGWLFRKVRGYISESMDKFPAEDVGTVGQAFCAALQDELSEYYKLLAILEEQAMNPLPLVSETATSGNYISLRRLSVWLAEPMVKMRLMALLVDGCKVLRGGAMVGSIHLQAQHGDPTVHDFLRRLLRRVSSPLFEMVRTWVLEGELEDIFSEFFILGQSVKAESLWREGYRLHSGMLPSFISQTLAQRILRTGKSINFLRVCCEDRGWADAATEAAAAAGTTTTRGGLGYGETDALESLVAEAAKRIDKHLMEVIYKRYKFKDHCLAIKRYLLLGQGDFVQYLMDIVGPELSEPANTISSFKLAGLLETAIRSSNAQYDDSDILDRLKVKMMPHNSGDRGWDVFSLEYDTRIPLNTVFTESVMERYLRIFNFLWKLRRVEHALIGTWKMMKPNSTSAHFKLQQSVRAQLLLTSRKCQVLWDEMNHFVTNLQYYIMFEVLEVSWSQFTDEMEAAKDLDDLLAAHDKYLHSIVEKSLLGDRSQALYNTLFVLFDLVLRFRSHADRLYEAIHEYQARTMESSRDKNKTSKPGSWISEGRKALTQRAIEFLKKAEHDIDIIGKEYSLLLNEFISQLPLQQHIDLKFLLFRFDFTEFYSRIRPENS
ncbi:gamma-tubulin complex component 3 [Impatiens glandulifera]|uniref:gamma-tubulin complex component 3 n=1 Tax=Impatiens glandulifera TaxID=253017 RepID=UPI001FB0C5D7|nr:gamma-tubulin complex component 3 [Impatiens glandulifera]